MTPVFTIKLDRYRIAIADVYWDDWLGYWVISRINVPHGFRGRGHGSELLRQICAEADATNQTLALGISPSDGLTFRQLETWYMKYGFVPAGVEKRGFYIRLPQTREI